jgi:hypothetical protein
VPGDVRRRGSWQGMQRGNIEDLKPEFWLDLQEQGFVLMRTELAVFKPEA